MAIFRLTAGHPETQPRIWYPDDAEGTAGLEETRILVTDIASHLNHPLGGGMSSQVGETHPATFQMNEKQDVVRGETR